MRYARQILVLSVFCLLLTTTVPVSAAPPLRSGGTLGPGLLFIPNTYNQPPAGPYYRNFGSPGFGTYGYYPAYEYYYYAPGNFYQGSSEYMRNNGTFSKSLNWGNSGYLLERPRITPPATTESPGNSKPESPGNSKPDPKP
jgi:hypothetical protein